jgi:large subunit ribosomal protein L10
MPTEKKIATVKELTELLSRSTVVVGTDYRGLRVRDVTALRRQLRDQGIEMHVIKNTLFARAAAAVGKPEMAELCEGPTAIVVGFDDPVAPVKTLVEYQRTSRNTFAARKAYMDGQIYAAASLPEIAALPAREVLIAELAGNLQSTLTTFAYLIQATLQELFGLIDARSEQVGAA